MSRFIPVCLFLCLTACNQEKRTSEFSARIASPVVSARETTLIAGPHVPVEAVKNPFENNQQAISSGERLYKSMNCSGCHAPYGGGAIGPPLIDDEWIYGNEAVNIFETIVKGRPNGMPSFAGKLPEYQIWQLVTFVQSMSPAGSSSPVKEQAR